MQRRLRFWTEEKLTLLKEFYPSMLIDELIPILGCCYLTIHNKAKELGLKKNDLYWQKRSEINRQTCYKIGKQVRPYKYGHPKTLETRKKIGDARRRIYRQERRRVLFGLPQQTKLKVRL